MTLFVGGLTCGIRDGLSISSLLNITTSISVTDNFILFIDSGNVRVCTIQTPRVTTVIKSDTNNFKDGPVSLSSIGFATNIFYDINSEIIYVSSSDINRIAIICKLLIILFF